MTVVRRLRASTLERRARAAASAEAACRSAVDRSDADRSDADRSDGWRSDDWRSDDCRSGPGRPVADLPFVCGSLAGRSWFGRSCACWSWGARAETWRSGACRAGEVLGWGRDSGRGSDPGCRSCRASRFSFLRSPRTGGAAKARTSTESVTSSGSLRCSSPSGERVCRSLAYRRSMPARPDSSRMAVLKRSVGRASFSSSCLRSHIGTK